MIVKIKNYHGYKGNNSMKYIKIFFIFFAVMNSFIFCADQSLVADEAQKNEAPHIEISTKDNELLNWNNHLNKLKDHWNSSTNIPDQEWIDNAISIAIDTLRINKELAQELKDSFFNAIKQHNAEFTKDTTSLITKFDNAVDKELETSETVVEKKEESVTAAPQTAEKVPTPPEPQPEEVPALEAAPAPTETTAQPIEKAPEPELPKETKKEEEKKEDFLKEWKECLTNMQDSKSNLYTEINKAIELAQKLQASGQMDAKKLMQEFSQDLKGAALMHGFSESSELKALSDFAQALGIYIPMSKDSYRPTKAELDMLSREEETVKMQRKLAEKEEQIQIAKRDAESQKLEAMVTQEAIRLEAEKRQLLSLSESQKKQINRMEAEQQNTAESLKQLQAAAEELRLELKKAAAEQKAAAEKSLFTRAKETVTGFIWGSNEIQSPEESIQQKEEQLKQLTKQIEDEKTTLQKQIYSINEELNKIEEYQARTGHMLTKREMARKEKLERDQQELYKKNAAKEFKKQAPEWFIFMDELSENKQATLVDNNKATDAAINQAKALLAYIHQHEPSKNILEKGKLLKIFFTNALLAQQRDNENKLNYHINIEKFNQAINEIITILEQTNPGQQTFQLTQ